MKVLILVTIVALSPVFNVSAQTTTESQPDTSSCKNYQEEELQEMTEQQLLDTILENNNISTAVIAEIRSNRQQGDVGKLGQLNDAYNRCEKSNETILRFKMEKFPPPAPPKPKKY